jgi:hypothetical protein
MIARSAATLALRNRALAVSVATTGTMSLEATAVGYARATGSFVTDGFVEGMEILPTGFADTEAKVISLVAADLLTIDGGLTVEASAGSRALTCGAPYLKSLENARVAPVTGRWLFNEQLVPSPMKLVSMPADGGLLEERGLYLITLYAPEDRGHTAIAKVVDALLARFTPGTSIVAGSETLRIEGDPGPFAGQIIPRGEGFATCTIQIPYRAHTRNAVAA